VKGLGIRGVALALTLAAGVAPAGAWERGHTDARRGDVAGVSANGMICGLVFPARLAFSPDGLTACASNLALFQPDTGVSIPGIDAAWALEVKHDTIAKIRADLPAPPARATE
jgi:hypothetical protein